MRVPECGLKAEAVGLEHACSQTCYKSWQIPSSNKDLAGSYSHFTRLAKEVKMLFLSLSRECQSVEKILTAVHAC